MKSKIMWRPFRSYMLISVSALILIGLYGYFTLGEFFMSQAARAIEVRARVAALRLETEEFSIINSYRIQKIAEKIGAAANARITVIDRQGRILGESGSSSNTDPLTMPEFIDALAGKTGEDLRPNKNNIETLYVALPVIRDGEVIGAIRASKNLKDFVNKRKELQLQFIVFIITLLLIMTLLSYFLSCRYSQPLKLLAERANLFAGGDFNTRIDTQKTKELTILAKSFNYMAETIQKRMDIIISQSNNLNAILNSMTDAVLAVDSDESIIDVNPAALKWLELPREEVEGRSMQEVIRHKALQNFIREAIQNNSPKDADITIFLDNEHVLNVKSSPIYDVNNTMNGSVIVFYDVTKIRHLENLRRDFVSNVSHEIRTPLTVIKGSTEILRQTLSETTGDNTENLRFLEIINKHTERLTALINDLLLLSRIEQDTTELSRSVSTLLPIISTAINALEPKIEEKGVIIMLECDPELTAKINSGLIEQALINLIDNAIKYSQPNSSIEITAAMNETDKTCYISVKDNGPGIDRKHFDRLFERFYRVDEARSRKIGGTGLGLAIVKHIVRAHNGSVELVSEPGVGSIFTIVLPVD